MRIGIIGCGNIAQVHAWSLSQSSYTELVALADCNISKAINMSKKYTDGNAKTFENYLLMLDEMKLDAVHICTPHYLHVPMAIEALSRNISVFMEKPPAITQDEFIRLEEVANHSKGLLGFCFQNRYNATTKELDRIVKSNMLGSVKGVRGFVTWKREADYYSDDWHGTLEKEGGGVLINQSIHTLDLILRYLGEPQKIGASMQNHHLNDIIEVEDTLEAWMEFEGGQRACFYATTAYATDAPVIIEISFENGRVTMIDKTLTITKASGECEHITCEDNVTGVGKSYWGNSHLACIKDFYNSLQTKTPFINDLTGVKNTLNTTMKIYSCARK